MPTGGGEYRSCGLRNETRNVTRAVITVPAPAPPWGPLGKILRKGRRTVGLDFPLHNSPVLRSRAKSARRFPRPGAPPERPDGFTHGRRKPVLLRHQQPVCRERSGARCALGVATRRECRYTFAARRRDGLSATARPASGGPRPGRLEWQSGPACGCAFAARRPATLGRMAVYRKTLFVTPERRKRQNREAQQRLRDREKARAIDADPARKAAAAAERAERDAAAALVAALQAPFEPDAIYSRKYRYDLAFLERVETAKALAAARVRKRRMPAGSNPLLADLDGDGEGGAAPAA